MKLILSALLWVGLLVMPMSCQNAQAGASANDTKSSTNMLAPDKVALEFYKWYVKQANDEGSPLIKSPRQLKVFVSASLWKILQQTHGVEKDADYFLKAQDTLDDWADNVAVSPGKAADGATHIVVTLGASTETKQRLLLTMVQEDGRWKIQGVTELHQTH